MQFNAPETNDGLLQTCDRWCNLGRNAIANDDGLKSEFTAELNGAFDELLPLIYAADSKWQWDDSNYNDQPIATFDLVSGQNDYSFTEDEGGNSILEITQLFVRYPDGTWKRLEGVDSSSDPATDSIFAQNTTNVGTPIRYDKLGTTVFLDPVPNYSATPGVRAVFKRSQSYFTVEDTDKEPGIPRFAHQLLALIASRNWLAIHKSESGALPEVKEQIANKKADLSAHLARRSKDEKTVMRSRAQSSR
jgi:hypothetical protein